MDECNMFELLDNVESTQHVHSNLAWCGPGMRGMFSNLTKDLTVERRGGMDLLAYIPSLQVVGLYGREREECIGHKCFVDNLIEYLGLYSVDHCNIWGYVYLKYEEYMVSRSLRRRPDTGSFATFLKEFVEDSDKDEKEIGSG
jgi:hypothetical protein